LALIADSGDGNWPPALLTSASMPAVPGEHRGDGLAHRRLLADVAGVRRADAALRLDLGTHRLELVELPADDRHERAERRQLVRRAAPDAGTAAGDDGHPASEEIGGENGSIARHGGGFNQALAW
jgi:hypothetical protein